MDEATNIGNLIIGAAAVFAVVAPMLKLNSSIVKLIIKVDQLTSDINRNEGRITKHGMEIEDLDKRVTNHEFRINQIEKHIEE